MVLVLSDKAQGPHPGLSPLQEPGRERLDFTGMALRQAAKALLDAVRAGTQTVLRGLGSVQEAGPMGQGEAQAVPVFTVKVGRPEDWAFMVRDIREAAVMVSKGMLLLEGETPRVLSGCRRGSIQV